MEIKNILEGNVKCRVSIEYIGETVKPNDEKTFIKRDFGLIVSEEFNGKTYESRMAMQFIGATDKPQFDKTALLDNFNPGDLVDVVYSISGSVTKNEKLTSTVKNPGCLNGFNNLSASSITKVGQPQSYQQPVNAPAPKQGAPYPQPAGAVPLDANNNPKVWNAQTGNWEDLPF